MDEIKNYLKPTALLLCCALLCSCSSKPKRNVASDYADNSSQSSDNSNLPTPPSSNNPNERFYFDWPVDEARMTRGFSLEPTGKRRKPHLGIDLAAPKRTRILAAHDGTVVYVGRDFKGYGRLVLLEGKQGWATLYGHLTKALVQEGDVVKQGDLIAQMGRTGRATGVHLHFEIRKDKGPVDPLYYLPKPATITDRVSFK